MKPSSGLTVEQRFWRLTARAGDDECWIWRGSLQRGYGRFIVNNWPVRAHRWAYEHFIGPVPEGLVLDHLCRNRACVNPAHLEPVTSGENVLRGESFSARNARKTHCIHGHPLSGDNLTIKPSTGERVCRECRRAEWQRYAPKRPSRAGNRG